MPWLSSRNLYFLPASCLSFGHSYFLSLFISDLAKLAMCVSCLRVFAKVLVCVGGCVHICVYQHWPAKVFVCVCVRMFVSEINYVCLCLYTVHQLFSYNLQIEVLVYR